MMRVPKFTILAHIYNLSILSRSVPQAGSITSYAG
jgi:hypothetical protein